ncbi:MAG: protein kinase [Bacteroidota bacterium]
MLLFNRYEYNPQTDIAGRGELSRVYKAVDIGNQEMVAVKVYKINDFSEHYHPIHNTEIIKAFVHPGLCSYLDIREIEKEDSFGEMEKLQVCITSFLNAGNLVEYYGKHPDINRFIDLLRNVLNGLSYLHQKSIIHGYIKPSNVLVEETNNQWAARITDFGMGIFSAVTAPGTGSHLLLTGLPYRSPEQLNAADYGINGKVSFNTDLWSLALVVYEALAGEPLFIIDPADFPDTIAKKITSFRVTEKVHALPKSFQPFLLRCLVKDAGQRIQTAEELLSLLPASAGKTGSILDLGEPAAPEPSQQHSTTLLSTGTEDTDDTRIIALPKKDKSTNGNTLPLEEVLSGDETRIISPAKDIPAPLEKMIPKDEPEEDVTRIIGRSAGPLAATDSPQKMTEIDDTKIISGAGGQMTVKNRVPDDVPEEDATRIIAHPTEPLAANCNPQEIPASDDTQIIGPAKNDQEAVEKTFTNNSQDEDATRVINRHGTAPSAAIPPDEDKPVDETIIIGSVNKESQYTRQPVKTEASTGSAQPFSENDTPKKTAEEKQPDIIIRRREKPVMLFNRYEYLPATDLIGKGGFSRVYKAYDKKLSRWVALKIYKTGEFSDRYSPIAEIKRVVNLDHPNICRYLDIEEIENENPFGENEKIQVCVMELLDSGNFAEYYKANKNPETLKKLIQDILNGLSYLHKNGIIHRDIKPGNILIKQTIEGPVAKITDFGISKNSDAENNSSSALIVSIPYMAPEQLNAKKYGINEKISFNLDLWSLGVTIYEVVTGKALFKNSDQDNSEQIMSNIMAPELPAKLNDLPEPFKTIVSHCVIKNARERASRAEELMVLLHIESTPANSADLLASQAANTVIAPETENMEPPPPEPEKSKAEISVLPSNSIEKTFPSRFSIAHEEIRPLVIHQKKKPNLLAWFIGTAVFLFILFIIFLKTCNQAPATINSGGAHQQKDTARLNRTVPAKLDTAHAKTADPTGKKDTVTKNTSTTTTVPRTTEKKKEKPVDENRRKTPSKTTSAGSSNAAKYVLILSAEQACTLKVNSIAYGIVEVGIPLKLFLVPGKYILQFVSTTNSASTFTATIEVKLENLGHADKFKIQLK